MNVIKQRKHLTNIFWSNYVSVFLIFIGLATSVIFTHLGGIKLYGQYTFVLSVSGFFSLLTVPGVRTVILKAISLGYDGTFTPATKLAFKFGLLQIPAILFMGLYYYFLRDRGLGSGLMCVALLTPFLNSLITWQFYLKGKSRFKYLSFMTMLLNLMNFIILAFLLLILPNLLLIIITLGVAESAFNICLTYKFGKETFGGRVEEGWARQSFSLSIMDFSSVIFGSLDILIIGFLLPISQVAIYTIVMGFSEVVFKLMRSTIEAVLPRLYDNTLSFNFFLKYFLFLFVVPLLAIPFIRTVVLAMYGKQFLPSVSLIKIYMFSVPFNYLTAIALYFMVKNRLTKQINVVKILSIVMVSALYFILIPIYGILGGVIASMCYFVFQSIISVYYVLKFERRGIPTSGSLL